MLCEICQPYELMLLLLLKFRDIKISVCARVLDTEYTDASTSNNIYSVQIESSTTELHTRIVYVQCCSVLFIPPPLLWCRHHSLITHFQSLSVVVFFSLWFSILVQFLRVHQISAVLLLLIFFGVVLLLFVSFPLMFYLFFCWWCVWGIISNPTANQQNNLPKIAYKRLYNIRMNACTHARTKQEHSIRFPFCYSVTNIIIIPISARKYFNDDDGRTNGRQTIATSLFFVFSGLFLSFTHTHKMPKTVIIYWTRPYDGNGRYR